MQIKFFRVPAGEPEEFEEELNRFLRGHRILTVERNLVTGDGRPYWSVVVEYQEKPVVSGRLKPGSAKEDYRDLLSAEDFAVFCQLKEARKALAEEAGIPVYAVFTNRHLGEMARLRCRSVEEIAKISGVGAERAAKYSDQFISILGSGGPGGLSDTNSGAGESSGGLSPGSQGQEAQAGGVAVSGPVIQESQGGS